MIGKFIALIAVAAVASAEPCGYCGGYLSTGISGYGSSGIYGSRVLNVGCSVPVASAFPSCSPVAVPSHVVDPIPTSTVSSVSPVVSTGLVSPVVSTGIVSPVVSTGVVSPVVSTGVVSPVVSTGIVSPVVSSGLVSSGVYGSGCYGGYEYGSTLGGCGSRILSSVC